MITKLKVWHQLSLLKHENIIMILCTEYHTKTKNSRRHTIRPVHSLFGRFICHTLDVASVNVSEPGGVTLISVM